MKVKILVPTFRVLVTVKISNDVKKLSKWNNETLKHFNDKEKVFDVAGRSYGIYNDKGYRKADIVINQNFFSIGVLVHELLHCVSYILNYVNIPFNEETEEVYACLLDSLTDVFLNRKKVKKLL